MGVPTSEVGYTPAMSRREDHEVRKRHVVALGKKKSVQLLSEMFRILRITRRDININLRTSSCEVPLFSSDVYKNLIFVDWFSKKNFQVSNLMKIRPVGDEFNPYRTNVENRVSS